MKIGIALSLSVSALVSCLWGPIAIASDGAPTLPEVAAPAAAVAAAGQPSLSDLNQAARAEIVARLKKTEANLIAEQNQPALAHYAQIYPTAPSNGAVKMGLIPAGKLQQAWATHALGQLPASDQGKLDSQQSFAISGPNLNIRDQRLGIALKLNLMNHSTGVDDSIAPSGAALMHQIRVLKVGDSLDHLVAAVNSGQLDQQIGPLSSESQQIAVAEKAAKIAAAAAAATEAAAAAHSGAAKPPAAVNNAPVTATKPPANPQPGEAPGQPKTAVNAGSLT